MPVPDIRAGERLMAAFLSPRVPANRLDDLREVRDIADGVLRLGDQAPERREVLFFISSRTGMMVKRAAVGAEGYVLNHYDRAAVDRYLEAVGGRLLAAFGSQPPEAVFCDSLEVYESDWTDDFLDEFRTRRGYDLRPLLPALVIDSPASAGLRHDWGRTLTELARERFLDPVQAWARSHGTRFRVQGYGVPPAIVSSNAGIDLPEGEGSQWKTVRASRWASSIGHLYDRPVISSETWTWLHSPVFRATPLDLKAEADLHFLQGINQLVGHGWPYSADGVAYPGWRFYAAGAFNDRNPWWIVMPDLARYLQRMSFLLRQGQPVNDVAIYLPVDDTWAGFVPGKVGSMIEAMNQRVGPDLLPAVLAAGFNVDFVDDGVLAGRARHRSGRPRDRCEPLPGDHPARDRADAPASTIRVLERRGGGACASSRRDASPRSRRAHLASAADHAEVAAGAAAALFSGPARRGRVRRARGRPGAALTSRLQPDMVVIERRRRSRRRAPPHARRGHLLRREHVERDRRDDRDVPRGRFPRRSVGRDDGPFGGGAGRSRCGGQAEPAREPEAATVALELAPYASTVLVFPTGGRPAASPPASVRTTAASAAMPAALDISTGWRVRVGEDGAPETWDALRSWTDDERTRYFSGVATYEKQVDVPASMLKAGRAMLLDFGAPRPLPVGGPTARVQAWLDAPVREAVVVTVNGARAGSVWCPPYALDVTAWLRPGANTIRLDVANLAINHMAGHALPDYKLLNLRYGTRFEPQDMDQVQPVPSGLFGPIRLVAAPAARRLTPSR